jgi:hypothetical protein
MSSSNTPFPLLNYFAWKSRLANMRDPSRFYEGRGKIMPFDVPTRKLCRGTSVVHLRQLTGTERGRFLSPGDARMALPKVAPRWIN